MQFTLNIISNAMERRKHAQTNANYSSSRSHFLFEINYKVENKIVSLMFIDLAGAERLSQL